MDTTWDDRADVVVVGFGAAGACAAIEAAGRGADVLVVDRFTGGGATTVSGGVVYAGGGTEIQRTAGVADSVGAMLGYLTAEVGDAVSPATLRRFCAESPGMIDWLGRQGVPFQASLCPYKTSYPSNEFYLYQSGSESAWPYRSVATPAARGHRAHGRGTSGRVLFGALAGAAARAGARVLAQTGIRELVVEDGRVAGVAGWSLSAAPGRVRRAHALLYRYASKPGLYVPAVARRLARRITALERAYGRPVRVAARRGVVLAAGGFVANRAMLREHAPEFRGGLPLGTLGDDGSGIRLGISAGAATARLGNVSAWRFLNPPSALLRGILVDATGQRFVDESSYGAAIGHKMITEHAGRAWLLVDEPTRRLARRQLGSETLWFQRLQARYLLASGLRGPVEQIARRAGIDADGLCATLASYNDGTPDRFGKHPDLVHPLTEGPFTLIDCSSRNVFPCPMLTLGGLAVDEDTGAVLTATGAPVPGLYAAGRTAVGICSNSYVSGLSLADCVFSGRRAGSNV
ncbi:FAD-binding protein [Actinophytocola sp.]|uniref:FAD-binding protein n=1 Tax=Actinophytocola sp. TaxID=1872138 RepID=UPI002D7E22E0|nr:FAD-binding protein [Actinophytocola sp.]HET9138586.1 FAD-binding protein [Actinophytocola sp.]